MELAPSGAAAMVMFAQTGVSRCRVEVPPSSSSLPKMAYSPLWKGLHDNNIDENVPLVD